MVICKDNALRRSNKRVLASRGYPIQSQKPESVFDGLSPIETPAIKSGYYSVEALAKIKGLSKDELFKRYFIGQGQDEKGVAIFNVIIER